MGAANRNRTGSRAPGAVRKNQGVKKSLGFSGLRFIANLFLSSRPTRTPQGPTMSCSELYRFKTLRFRINGITSK